MDERIAVFRRLHESGCFVMPNPWHAGAARMLEAKGFPALATTSSGFAWTTGRPDNHVTLDDALAHFRAMAAAVSVPVNADFENAFAVDPEGVHRNFLAALETGVAGISIEDSTGDPADPLYDFGLAVERVRAAREAVDAGGTGVVLTARTEGFVAGRPDIDETLRRLQAFSDAGADCLYAPGIRDEAHIRAVVEAVAPKPVNLLVNAPFITRERAAELGVRRISTGGALAKTAWKAVLAAVDRIAEGRFNDLVDLPDVDSLFS
ncbi:MAG: isocitrate lyase/phosphoenolpyruvate mutase family protein [Actinomycetes bacterium]|jgi:2-methylisocitrate lyase-like PEP mutase family enzyme|nr:MAG: 2-methylisocitrate lyase [Actinomycetota bacterium]